MNAAHDATRLIADFLEEGPAVLPDRVLEAVHDEIRQTTQLRRAPWRFITMPRMLFAGSALAAVAVIAVLAVLLTNAVSESRRTGTSPTPGGSSTDAAPLGELVAGRRYHAATFGEPFRFVLPNLTAASVDRVSPTSFLIRGSGVAAFYDDAAVIPPNLCDGGAPIAMPASPEAVGAWLQGMVTFPGLDVTERTSTSVDGRQAQSWDVSCRKVGPPQVENTLMFQAGDPHRIYAIPSGDDTILLITSKGGGDFDSFNRSVDELVRSITFD